MSYWEALYSAMPDQPGEEECANWLDAYGDKLKPGAHALDLGCGRGANIPALLAMGLRVTAADFSPSAIRLAANAYPSIETACFDMTQRFPFADGAFDAVIADLSLHYFSWQDTQRIIGEIARVLVPGGWLIARVHSVRNVDAAGLDMLEPNYYVSGGYPRRYFTPNDIRLLFGSWARHDAQETQIIRFSMVKQVIVFTAQTKA